MTSANGSLGSSPERPGGDRPAPTAQSGRRTARRTGQSLGIAWLHGSLTAAVFRRQILEGSHTIPRPVHTVEEFGVALDEIIATREFAGSEVFLVLEHEQFSHQTEPAPAISERAARAYLQTRVARHEKDHGRVVCEIEMVVYKGYGHGITKPKSMRAVMAHNLAWFGHYIFGDPLPDLTKIQ